MKPFWRPFNGNEITGFFFPFSFSYNTRCPCLTTLPQPRDRCLMFKDYDAALCCDDYYTYLWHGQKLVKADIPIYILSYIIG